MNKKTRQFIWGLLGFSACGIALGVEMNKIHDGVFDWSAWNVIAIIIVILATFSFANRIYKTL